MASKRDTKIFQLESGAKVCWKKSDAFQKYRLEVIDHGSATGCGNPYNLMTYKERKNIEDERPESLPPPCNLDSVMYHKIIEGKDLTKELVDDINGDCWGIFTTTSDRKKILKLYYDLRNSEHSTWIGTLSTKEYHRKVDEISKDRFRLAEDPTDLMNDIKEGHTVVFVLGDKDFIEIYYCKIGDQFIKITIDHTLHW